MFNKQFLSLKKKSVVQLCSIINLINLQYPKRFFLIFFVSNYKNPKNIVLLPVAYFDQYSWGRLQPTMFIVQIILGIAVLISLKKNQIYSNVVFTNRLYIYKYIY